MNALEGMHEEVRRIKRVCDSLCTAHAALRDRFARRAFTSDLIVLGASIWIVALAFVESRINVMLTPFGWNSQIWVGLLSIATFFLTIVQIKADWKARSDAHKRSLDLYAEVKREAGYLLASDIIEEQGCRRVFARYDMASAVAVEIPERDFLALKQRHKVKVELSRYLDSHPGASLLLTRIRFWIRDNFGPGSNNAT
jgi:hypothetical protein